MCGIVGIIDTVADSVSRDLLFAMRDLMVQRGPDGEGHYFDGPVGMAMRRLSIIDLEGGWQPFFSRDDTVVAFQNGEIYNFKALRESLQKHGHIFKSHSDTEVLAHGYTQWGIDRLLERLDGMFAMAILDKGSRTLYLARDRFGEKPLFYAHAAGRFAYSSNLQALAALPWVGDEIDPISTDYYLGLHYVPGDMTIFKSIRRVPPGCYLKVPVDNPLPQSFRYYRPALNRARMIADHELAGLVEESVSSRLVADVPVGVFLSGGLDSSIVAAIAAKKQPEVLTFSMGFASKTHDESADAAQVANAIGSRHHSFVFDEDSFIKLLPEVAAALDEPVGDQAMLPLYWLCREARKQVKVVLAGEGADEVFAGYSYYRRFSSAGWRDRLGAWLGSRRNRSARFDSLLAEHDLATPSGFPLLTDSATRRALLGTGQPGQPSWEKDMLQWLRSANDPLQRATAADIASWLPDDLLVKFDRMAMVHSLEGRAPYLHPDIVAAGLSLAPRERMSGGISKVALRRVAERWVPREILEKPKQGFVLPMRRWLQQWFELKGTVGEYFAGTSLPFIDIDVLSRLVEHDLGEGIKRERLLFAVVMLCEWYRHHIGVMKDLRSTYRECGCRP